ncbi:hypothetical protein EPO33_03610 [Patescibacteria group bacterium]|nr:MAG: hypothetical protein EPO33_03610 [Patescibacteria group bacterium]
MTKKKEKKRDLNAEAGVSYDDLDPFKIACLEAARKMLGRNLLKAGYRVLDWSRGESVFLIEKPGRHVIGLTIEGLGTKNQVPEMLAADRERAIGETLALQVIAEELEALGLSPDELWENVGICNANTVFNDMASLGVPPFVFNLFLAIGSSAWATRERRRAALIRGTAKVVEEVGATWGGGETQRLGDGQVGEAHAVLAGAALGIVDPPDLLIRGDVKPGDGLIALDSTGLHANGYSTARGVARKLKNGMLTELADGTLYGQALMAPTASYSPFIQALISAGIQIRYVVPMTGHGVRKLMRLQLPYDYELVSIPKPQPVFDLIQRTEQATDREMYETYNMGMGCVLVVRGKDVGSVLHFARVSGFGMRGIRAREAGGVTKNKKGERRVIMPSRLKMEPFQGSELSIR